MNKKKCLRICICVIAVLLLSRLIWVYLPSEASVVYYDPDLDVTIREELSYEETVKVKSILYGKFQWPEWLYGYPACGFGSIYAIRLDGKYYMPAWDSCGMVAVMDASGEDDTCTYMNLTQRQIKILHEIISSRGSQ